jgi:hypothetical protein
MRQGQPTTIHDLGIALPRWREMLIYVPETGGRSFGGSFTRHSLSCEVIPQRWATQVVRGAHVVRIDGFTIGAARLVWLLHHGRWPNGQLRRHDGDNLNDRIENLYERSQPGDVTHTAKPSGGVARHYHRWQAYGQAPEGRKHLGVFDTREEAQAAHDAWATGGKYERPNPKRGSRGVMKRGDLWLVYGVTPAHVVGAFRDYSEARAVRDRWVAQQMVGDLV